jgi:hypothetical protein
MKIRIKNNAIRYRLTRTDVAQLSLTGYLEEKVNFAEQALVYAIELNEDLQLSSTYKNNTITLLMPRVMIAELADTDRVGFENNTGDLYLLVEKDFTCLDEVAEDQSDNYPNPLAEKAL